MITFKQWREALGGVGDSNMPPVNPNEPSKLKSQSLIIPPIDMRARMQKLKINKPIQ